MVVLRHKAKVLVDCCCYVIVDSARCFRNCEASGVTSFEDRHALINCMSILAQQINATSFVDGAKDAVFLMQAFELLLSSIEVLVVLDIPNVVVLINRFFRVLSAATQRKVRPLRYLQTVCR